MSAPSFDTIIRWAEVADEIQLARLRAALHVPSIERAESIAKDVAKEVVNDAIDREFRRGEYDSDL